MPGNGFDEDDEDILAINLSRDGRVETRHLALNFFAFRGKPDILTIFTSIVTYC